ncbi:hypothetical protein P7266_1771 [Lactococcus cremoris]|nr:hypothetical protein P7266_1771 [Lactococcus cremoris]
MKAWELDRDNNPQMDLFDNDEPKDVTAEPEKIEAPETIDGEFDEVE